MMQTAASGSSILRGFVMSRKAAIGPARLLTVGDPDGGFVTALLRTERNIAQDRCHCGQCDKPRRARLIGPSIRNVARARSIISDVLAEPDVGQTIECPARKFEPPRRLAHEDFS